MVNKMHWIFCISILVLGLYGESFHVSAQECSSIPLSDPTRVVVTPPTDGDNYFFYERISLSCNSSGEYTFTGNDYSYCVGSNQWDPDPSTVLCYEKCADNLIPEDVIQEDEEGNTTKSYYDHGEYIYLSCTASQTLIGPSQVTCLDGSIGDDTIACQGGTTTAVFTSKQTTTAPLTSAPQEETTLAVQTIINTAMVSATSNDGRFITGQTDATTQVQTELLTSIDYMTDKPSTDTEAVTDAITDTVTQVITNPVTNAVTDTVTDSVTGTLTYTVTDGVTEAITNTVTQVVTEAITDAITDTVTYAVTPVVTDAVTDTVTEAVTDAMTDAITYAITDDVTDTITEHVTQFVTDTVTSVVTGAVTDSITDAGTDAITYIVTDAKTDSVTDTVTEIVTEAVTDSATKAVTDVVTDIVTDSATKAVTDVITEIVTYIATDSVETEQPVTASNDVTTLITDISATDDDGVTTSATAVTELESTRVTVITEVVTEIDEFTEFTTSSDSNMTTMSPNPCDFCDPDRERCVAGSDGPLCECLPGFYRITQDKSETDVQCTEAILFEVDARITKINGQVVDFTDDLNNSSSARFNYLEDLICSTLEPVQNSISGFLACQVTSFSSGSIIAVIDLYFSELSNATEIEVFNETVAAFAESNITAEVTRVELVVPSTSTTVSATTPIQTTTTTKTGTTGATSRTEVPPTPFVTTTKPTKKSTADTTLLVIYILIPAMAVLLLIVIGYILYQNKIVSEQYVMNNPGGKKPKKSKKKPKKTAKTSNKETNGHVNIASYNGITTGEDKSTQTTAFQITSDARPDSGVVVEEDVDHMVYPYPWNEPGRLEADDDDDKAIYAKVDRKSTHKNPPVIVEIELQPVEAEEPQLSAVDWTAVDASFVAVDEIELQPVVAEEPQLSPVDWTAVDTSFVAVEEETSITEAVMEFDSTNHEDDPAGEGYEMENEEYEAKDTGSQTEIEEEPDYIAIGGFELNEASSNHASESKDVDALHLDSISLELTSSMETEMDRRFSKKSTPC